MSEKINYSEIPSTNFLSLIHIYLFPLTLTIF